eukprot:scaffold72072_cov43-Phaeocystis_antarctica.AAC.4
MPQIAGTDSLNIPASSLRAPARSRSSTHLSCPRGAGWRHSVVGLLTDRRLGRDEHRHDLRVAVLAGDEKWALALSSGLTSCSRKRARRIARRDRRGPWQRSLLSETRGSARTEATRGPGRLCKRARQEAVSLLSSLAVMPPLVPEQPARPKRKCPGDDTSRGSKLARKGESGNA